MSYQSIATQHNSGNPPNTDAQRATETFTQYVLRMAASGFPPDILPTELDSDYVVRLAGYLPTPSTASYALTSLNDVLFTVSSSAQSLNIANPSTGSYYFAVANNKMFVYNGLKWVSGSFA